MPVSGVFKLPFKCQSNHKTICPVDSGDQDVSEKKMDFTTSTDESYTTTEASTAGSYNRSKGSRASAHIPAPRMWSAEETASLRSFLIYNELGRVM
jgi:hypothetical protein